MTKLSLTGVILAAAALILADSLYTVDQTQSAIILQFGEPVNVKKEAGLYAKIPFIQNVIRLDNRLMEYDLTTTIIYTNDKKNMVLDAYVRWRIVDPLLFYKRFKSDNSYSIIEDAKRRLGDVIIGELKSELGLHIMSDVISQSRANIMESVTGGSNRKLLAEGGESSGLEVVDTRIKRADLPPENQRSVYERMKAERDQQATKYRSEGQMRGQKIRAEADRQKEVILAEAQRTSQEIQGEADAQAAATYAEAFNQDPEFYVFTRSLESYQNAFRRKSTLVLSPETMDYLKYFGQAAAPGGAD
ncbi:MAG: protease modulator HflC [Candidatus Adiutrix sp.]|jgi:membrane protease subunit HflC|nr:protease modulator HflC [Candidatus Adiutrix sp.]